ncbi:hypothetical protein K438DRAFT_1989666 [Mycena galopus ATCC 62051]|nr:hypothetical protein K438DRAFT_1989666 [Mycena galopus ATCC 62051]
MTEQPRTMMITLVLAPSQACCTLVTTIQEKSHVDEPRRHHHDSESGASEILSATATSIASLVPACIVPAPPLRPLVISQGELSRELRTSTSARFPVRNRPSDPLPPNRSRAYFVCIKPQTQQLRLHSSRRYHAVSYGETTLARTEQTLPRPRGGRVQ